MYAMLGYKYPFSHASGSLVSVTVEAPKCSTKSTSMLQEREQAAIQAYCRRNETVPTLLASMPWSVSLIMTTNNQMDREEKVITDSFLR